MINNKKIPDDAKLVFKGILHDVYHWQQTMFDGTISTFEALKRKSSVIVIATTNQNVIIINESQPYNQNRVTLPGGISNDDEDLLISIKRELLEETGYISESWSFWKTIDILKYSKLEWESAFFIAKDCKKVAEQQLDSGEMIETKLLPFDEFVSLVQSDNFSNSHLRDYILKIKNDRKMMEDFYKLIF